MKDYETFTANENGEKESGNHHFTKNTKIGVFLISISVVISLLIILGVKLYTLSSSTSHSHSMSTHEHLKNVKSYSSATLKEKEALFNSFVLKHDKKYYNYAEAQHRFEIFLSNLEIIDQLNSKEQLSGGMAVHGITKFADQTKQEFEQLLTLLPPKKGALKVTNNNMMSFPTVSSDWRNNYVTAIKDQKRCGSCWAYSAVEQIESDSIRLLKGYDESLNLSIQELVDCDHYDSACNGGLMDTAWKYIEEIGGIEKEVDYPQTWTNNTCTINKNKFIIGLTSYTTINNDEETMMKYVSSTGPLAVCIHGNDLSHYSEGIIISCSSNDCNHAVQLVGINVQHPTPYWIVSSFILNINHNLSHIPS